MNLHDIEKRVGKEKSPYDDYYRYFLPAFELPDDIREITGVTIRTNPTYTTYTNRTVLYAEDIRGLRRRLDGVFLDP